jgi:hypothetical protein
MTTDGIEALADLGQRLVRCGLALLPCAPRRNSCRMNVRPLGEGDPVGGVASKPLSTTFAVCRRSADRDRR